MARRGVDWNKIKAEYITTDISQRKLAVKYAVSHVAVSAHSSAEQWVEERERYRARTLAKTLEKSSEKDAGRLARLMDTTTKAIDVAVSAFEDAEQFNRYLVERKEKYAVPEIDEDGEHAISERQWTEERIFRKIDTKALKELTNVLKDLTGLMRDFYNIPTPAQAEAQRIASERLALDQRKVVDTSNETIEVVIDSRAEEWAK